MALQIANPVVVRKVEALAKRIGLNKTATIERAVDRLLGETSSTTSDRVADRFDALLAQIDQVPDRVDATDPFEWDELGLPK